jgi:3-dehydroquinate dehydratase
MDIMGRSQAILKEAFTTLEKAATEMHLTFIERRNKYMRKSNGECR